MRGWVVGSDEVLSTCAAACQPRTHSHALSPRPRGWPSLAGFKCFHIESLGDVLPCSALGSFVSPRRCLYGLFVRRWLFHRLLHALTFPSCPLAIHAVAWPPQPEVFPPHLQPSRSLISPPFPRLVDATSPALLSDPVASLASSSCAAWLFSACHVTAKFRMVSHQALD